MKYNAPIVGLAFLFLLSACGPGFTPPLNPGDTVPPDKVLVIGSIVLDPPFDTVGKKKKDKEPLEIRLGLTYDLRQEIREGALYSADEAIAPVVSEGFFFPLPAGSRYIRSGQVMKVVGHHVAGPAAGMPLYEVLTMYGNIKLDVPQNARAVYVGTIVYKHDGKKLLSVSVRDDHARAMQDLAGMKLAGVKPGDVVKRLAVVVK